MTVAVARPASTVVVVRPLRSTSFEVLLVRRNDNVAFMAGAYVFPGGRVDDEDRVLAKQLERQAPPASRFHDLTPAEELAYRVAAVREMEEEAALWIRTSDLIPIAHWITPEIEARRYDTRFFLAQLPAGQEARHDDSEMTALVWATPVEAIDQCERGDILLPPPTWTTLKQLGRFQALEDALEWARTKPIVTIQPGFFRDDERTMLTLPGDPLHPTIAGWDVPEYTRFVLEAGRRWKPVRADLRAPASVNGLRLARVAPLVDQLLDLFNRRSMDLPEGLFDRRTQFLINGTAFEEMLGQSPGDPLILMLARGPAGYRFTAKAIQHALPDARLQRGELSEREAEGKAVVHAQCWLSGHLRGSGDAIETVFGVELVMNSAGAIERAAATLDTATLARLREARLRP